MSKEKQLLTDTLQNIPGHEKLKDTNNEELLMVLNNNSTLKEIGDKIYQREIEKKEYIIDKEKDFRSNEQKIFDDFNTICMDHIQAQKSQQLKGEEENIFMKFKIDPLELSLMEIFAKSNFLFVNGEFSQERAAFWFKHMVPYDKKDIMTRKKWYNKWRWQHPLDIHLGKMAGGNGDYYIFVSERPTVQEQKARDRGSVLRSIIGR